MAKQFSYDEAAHLAGDLFGRILDREADKDGYDYVLDCLEGGKKSIRELVLEYIASEEFIVHFIIGRTHAESVLLIHRLLLGRQSENEIEMQQELREFVRLGLLRYAESIVMSEEYEQEVGPDQIPAHGH